MVKKSEHGWKKNEHGEKKVNKVKKNEHNNEMSIGMLIIVYYIVVEV
jgi:hypothetical protein